jgi:hypothetical protein
MENLEIEVYKSLLETKVLFGVPRSVAIYTAIAFGTVIAVTENLLVIPIYIITAFVEAVLSKKDSQFIPIYISKLERSSYFNS